VLGTSDARGRMWTPVTDRAAGPRGPVGRFTVVGAISRHACNAALGRAEQRWYLSSITGAALGQDMRGDLASTGIDGQTLLPPSPKLSSVPLCVPFTLAEHLQSRCRSYGTPILNFAHCTSFHACRKTAPPKPPD
jgi:hypothetical protein